MSKEEMTEVEGAIKPDPILPPPKEEKDGKKKSRDLNKEFRDYINGKK